MWNLVPPGVAGAALAAGSFGLSLGLPGRNMHLWMKDYYFPAQPQPPVSLEHGPIDVFIAVCDHYEPESGRPGKQVGSTRRPGSLGS